MGLSTFGCDHRSILCTKLNEQKPDSDAGKNTFGQKSRSPNIALPIRLRLIKRKNVFMNRDLVNKYRLLNKKMKVLRTHSAQSSVIDTEESRHSQTKGPICVSYTVFHDQVGRSPGPHNQKKRDNGIIKQ